MKQYLGVMTRSGKVYITDDLNFDTDNSAIAFVIGRVEANDNYEANEKLKECIKRFGIIV